MTSVLRIEGWVECVIIERLSRFTVLVDVGGEEVRAYLCNTGRLRDLIVRGRVGYCLPRAGVGSTKLKLFAVLDEGGAALVDTSLQVRVFEELIRRGALPWLRGCYVASRNLRVGGSVLDYLLRCGEEEVLVEVKSAVLRTEGGCAAYPDCLSLRGRRHVMELIRYVESGGKAALVFIAALPNVKCFKPYAPADPLMPRLIREAVAKGVIVRAFSTYFNPEKSEVVLQNPDLPIET